MDINQNIPIQSISFPLLKEKHILLDILRLDLVHPYVSGNKWFKLKENIHAFRNGGYDALLTFGGAYSNHLTATAAACNAYQIPSIGIVRGEELQVSSNESLTFCSDQNMQLSFVSRSMYQKRNNPDFQEFLQKKYGHVLIVPEGGHNDAGRTGAQQITQLFEDQYDYVGVSAGTGTTFLGISDGLSSNTHLRAYIPIYNGIKYTTDWQTKHNHWDATDEYHFGGFGKYDNNLIQFMNTFYHDTNIPLDIVYTAKMMWGILQDIQKGYYKNGSKILAIHTGGLQGNSSIATQLTY